MNFYYVTVRTDDDCIMMKLFRSSRKVCPSMMKRALDRTVKRIGAFDTIVESTVQECSVPEAIRLFRCDPSFLNPSF